MKYYLHSTAEFVSMRAKIRQSLISLCPLSAELLFVALNEAVNNAFTHGCAEMNGHGVEIEIYVISGEICLRVSHQGVGLSPESINEAMPDDLEDHGRGLAIIRLCTDFAEFDHAGRELTMKKSIS